MSEEDIEREFRRAEERGGGKGRRNGGRDGLSLIMKEKRTRKKKARRVLSMFKVESFPYPLI